MKGNWGRVIVFLPCWVAADVASPASALSYGVSIFVTQKETCQLPQSVRRMSQESTDSSNPSAPPAFVWDGLLRCAGQIIYIWSTSHYMCVNELATYTDADGYVRDERQVRQSDPHCASLVARVSRSCDLSTRACDRIVCSECSCKSSHPQYTDQLSVDLAVPNKLHAVHCHQERFHTQPVPHTVTCSIAHACRFHMSTISYIDLQYYRCANSIKQLQ